MTFVSVPQDRRVEEEEPASAGGPGGITREAAAPGIVRVIAAEEDRGAEAAPSGVRAET